MYRHFDRRDRFIDMCGYNLVNFIERDLDLMDMCGYNLGNYFERDLFSGRGRIEERKYLVLCSDV